MTITKKALSFIEGTIIFILYWLQVDSMGSTVPVSLTTSFQRGQRSLCPNENLVSFWCVTNCAQVRWKVMDLANPIRETRLISFNGEQAGDENLIRAEIVQRAHSNYGTLLRCSSEECVSVLNIAGPTPSGQTRVECHNGTYSTMVHMEYYHGVADPPSEPVITTVNGSPYSVTVSWSPGPMSSYSRLSHFIVQLDEEPAVWIGPSVMTASLLSRNTTHGSNRTIHVQAVDTCGQTSPVASRSIHGGASYVTERTSISESTVSISESTVGLTTAARIETAGFEGIAVQNKGLRNFGCVSEVLIGALLTVIVTAW